jgi:hypothetical protein
MRRTVNGKQVIKGIMPEFEIGNGGSLMQPNLYLSVE